MTLNEVLKELEQYGDAQTKKTHMNHGAKEPLFGVKVEHLKKILKKTKKNHELSLELYKTGISDAMYLAGLMADEKKITEEDLDEWVKGANWAYLNEYAVPWVASETPFGFKLGLKWMKSTNDDIASAGWSTLASYAAVTADEQLDIKAYSELLDYIQNTIHNEPDRVKYRMNSFVIAIGTYIAELNPKAMEVAKKIGVVLVDMNGTACKVPFAPDYIRKVMDKGVVGKKRKMARC